MTYRSLARLAAAAFLSCASFGCSGKAASGEIDDGVVSNDTAASPATAPEPGHGQIRVYRFYDGKQHFQTLDSHEGKAAGFTLQTDDVRVMQASARGATKALYRCYAGSGDHFLSVSATCEGYRAEGLVGYMFPDAAPGTLPLTRCFDGATGDHVSTTHPESDCAPATGLHPEYVQGYLPGNDPFPLLDDQQTIFRLYDGQHHLFTLDIHEGGDAYVFERAGFSALQTSEIGADRHVFRCVQRATGYPFVSIDEDCEGQGEGRSLGWIFAEERPETIAITRCVHPAGTDHLVTTTPAECTAAKYVIEGLLGFVPAN